MRVINEQVIINNINKIKKSNDIIMVLKDNAYGIGICKMINIAKKCNINFFAVKNIDEAIFIKSLYKESKILLLGKTNKKNISLIKKYSFIPTINDYTDYICFKENNIVSHLEIDVGMNRFGIKNNYLAIINDSIIDEIYIHLFNDDINNKINLIENIGRRYNKKIHIGGSVAYGKTNAKLRIGRLLYEESIELYGQIINIKKVREFESVGYDCLFHADKDSYIGICNIGYKNGLNVFSESIVFINNREYKVVGKVCMDQCFILIDEHIKINDKVEFIGPNIPIKCFLEKNNLSFYEALLLIK